MSNTETQALLTAAQSDGLYAAYLIGLVKFTLEQDMEFHLGLIQFYVRRAWNAALEYQTRLEEQ